MVHCNSPNWNGQVKARSSQLISCPNTSAIDLYFTSRQSLYLINFLNSNWELVLLFWVPFKIINFNIWEWWDVTMWVV